mmetsp:Transcript_10322/g.26422  ORF Transcript_10322/g.26422 Transcript_10322/m.26422 type:complete len:279 (-) Transcript_10322:91-927(-)
MAVAAPPALVEDERSALEWGDIIISANGVNATTLTNDEMLAKARGVDALHLRVIRGPFTRGISTTERAQADRVASFYWRDDPRTAPQAVRVRLSRGRRSDRWGIDISAIEGCFEGRDIIHAIAGAPADSGLEEMDQITHVEGYDTSNMDHEDLCQFFRNADLTLSITVQRGDTNPRDPLTIEDLGEWLDRDEWDGLDANRRMVAAVTAMYADKCASETDNEDAVGITITRGDDGKFGIGWQSKEVDGVDGVRQGVHVVSVVLPRRDPLEEKFPGSRLI